MAKWCNTKMRIIKTIIIVIEIITILFIFNTVSVAWDAENPIVEGADGFIESGTQQTRPFNHAELIETSNFVGKTFIAVGIIAAVIVGLYIAIKIMIGSVTEKAEYKQMLIPYFVGVIVLFGAYSIWRIIVELFNQTQ